MHVLRNRERTIVDIPIVITTVLDCLQGRIVDLSEGGAQVVGCTLPAGSQCQIDLDGHVTFGTVRWSEEDRMGIRFPYEMTEGPLFYKLKQARMPVSRTPMAFQPRPRPIPAMTGAGGFGRRTG